MRQVGKCKEEPEDNEGDDGQGDQLPAKERPEFAVGEEVVDAFEGIEEGRADDVSDGLEGGRGDGARIRHGGKESVVSMP